MLLVAQILEKVLVRTVGILIEGTKARRIKVTQLVNIVMVKIQVVKLIGEAAKRIELVIASPVLAVKRIVLAIVAQIELARIMAGIKFRLAMIKRAQGVRTE